MISALHVGGNTPRNDYVLHKYEEQKCNWKTFIHFFAPLAGWHIEYTRARGYDPELSLPRKTSEAVHIVKGRQTQTS